MTLSKLVNAMAETSGLVGQKQAGQVAPATTSRRGLRHTFLDPEPLKRAKLHVERAIKEKKIFTVQGPYPIIRSLLRARGWVEKKFLSEGRVGSKPGQHRGSREKQLEEEEGGDGVKQGEAMLDPQPRSTCRGAQPSRETSRLLHSLWPLDEEEEKQEEEKQEEEQQDEDADAIHDIMSRLVRNQVPYFIWTNRCSAFDCELLQHDQVVNHYTRSAVFTTKNGLCQNLRNLPWFDQADPDTFFPRCYRLGNTNEQEAFIEDFRLTAARSLLKVALKRAEEALGRTEQPQKPGPGPTAHSQLLEEALHICELHLGSLAHEDIDRDALLPHKAGTNWDQFLRDYYRVVHEGARLMVTGAQQERCQTLLQRLKEQLPQMSMEGDHNVWILKPGAKSRGRGIVCTARLEELLQLVGCSGAPALRPGEWVVQKYVERPLLIFGTKFDVRQWFLVTDWNPLTVWFYRDSYLRFCSRTFSLRHLDSARHLCNVSIQKRYKPAWDQPSQLPPDQIWSSQQLQKYLAQTGRADAWHKVMVPGMKAAVLAALHSAQGQVGNRKGSFELYGADFIFGEDCQPWLLEINASPTMAPSSAVTSRLCASVQRDTLRVVIDHRKDPTCSTGGFELISKEVAVPMPPFRGVKLMVKGCSLKKPQLAQHHSREKPRITASSVPRRPAPPSASTGASQVPRPEAVEGDSAVVGQRSHHCQLNSAPAAQLQHPGRRARSQGLPQLSCPHGQAQPTLPPLPICPPARVPAAPPQDVPGCLRGPTSQPHSSHPSRVLHLPELAPGIVTCLVQPSIPVGKRTLAPSRLQKNCDTGGHPRGHSTLPVPPGATRRHSAPFDPSWTPSLGEGTQPPLRGVHQTRF